MIHSKRVLVVDGDRDFAPRLCNMLKQEQFSALGPAPTVFYAQQLLGRRKVDVVVIDGAQFGRQAFSFAEELRSRGMAVLLFGARAKSGVDAGMNTFVPKPAKPEDVLPMLREAMGLDGYNDIAVVPSERPQSRAPADERLRMFRTIGRLLKETEQVQPRPQGG